MTACAFCEGRGDRPVVPGGELDLEGWSHLECSACRGTGMVRTPCAITASAVFELLASGRFDLTTEAATQAGMERLLLGQFPRSAISREHRLGPADRPDFLIDGRIVIEVKGPRHRAPAVLRQLQRYAAYDQVEEVILATSRAMAMPSIVGARTVPLRVLHLGRAWL